MGKGLDLQS